MPAVEFAFRHGGPSGRGAGRIRYYVDIDDRCIGSVEGKTGDFRLDADYVSEEASERVDRYRTRVDAAQALLALAVRAETPPVTVADYTMLLRCKRGESFAMPALAVARMLVARGLLTKKRGSNAFRTTPGGSLAIKNYDAWAAKNTERRTAQYIAKRPTDP